MSSPGTQSDYREFTHNRGQFSRYPYSEKERQTKPKKSLSVFLCVLAVVFLCILVLLSVLHSTNIAPIVSDILDDVSIASIIEDFDYNNEFYVWYQVNGLRFNERRISYYELELFFKNDAVSKEIGNVVNDYVRALAAGNMDFHMTAGDAERALLNIKPELGELFNHQMTNEDIESLAKTMDDIIDFNSLSIRGMMEEFDVELPVPRFLISTGLIWVIGIICIIILGIIVFLRRDNLPGGFIAAATPVVLSGVIMFIFGLFLDAFSESLSRTVHRMAIHLGDPAGHMIQFGFVFAGSGVLVIVVSMMIRKYRSPGR